MNGENPLVAQLAAVLGDVIVLALERPDVVDAMKTIFAPVLDPNLDEHSLPRRQLAMKLGISTSTIDRLKLPSAGAGKLRRYDLEVCRAALAQHRGSVRVDDEVGDVARRNGLVVAR